MSSGPVRILILLCFVHGALQTAIDNEIVGEPTVECTSDGINLRVTTRNPFLGRIFVKLNPRGMMYSSTIIVSFHPIFVTKVDRAYYIQCFYGEISKTISAAINVSMIPTTELAGQMPMPTCGYSVRQTHLEGPDVVFARVGDKVVHRWDCDSDMYRFLVRDCYVEDGKGTRIEIIDSRGCSVDPVVLGDLNYDNERPVAYAESHVFKFADVSVLYFQCQIEVCLKLDGSCDRLTPPSCDIPRNLLRFKRSEKRHERRLDLEMDVKTSDITVLGVEQTLDRNHSEVEHVYERTERCLVGALGLVVIVTILGGSSLLFAFAVCVMFRRSTDRQPAGVLAK